MAKSKKSIDKDMMFNKIMPALAENPFASIEHAPPPSEDDSLAALRAQIYARTDTSLLVRRDLSTINVMEELVLRKIDDVIAKFNCCRCDRCRCDVTALALNSLPPKYIVADLRDYDKSEDEAMERQVYDALVKAVIKVRTKPSH